MPLQLHQGGSPAAAPCTCQPERLDAGMALEDPVHALAKDPLAFPVHDADVEDPLLAAGLEVIGDERPDVPRKKGVKVEGAVDRMLDRLVAQNADSSVCRRVGQTSRAAAVAVSWVITALRTRESLLAALKAATL